MINYAKLFYQNLGCNNGVSFFWEGVKKNRGKKMFVTTTYLTLNKMIIIYVREKVKFWISSLRISN